MRGFSHGYVSSFLLACFLLWGFIALTERTEYQNENGYEPK